MKIEKWIDFGADVEIEISGEEVRCAIAEAFSKAHEDTLGEEPSRFDILRGLNSCGAFLNAFTDDQIRLLKPAQVTVVAKFLRKAADQWGKEGGDVA